MIINVPFKTVLNRVIIGEKRIDIISNNSKNKSKKMRKKTN